MEPILIDTNLLVYMFDRRDKNRQDASIRLIDILARTGNGRLTAQCLSEFFSATTRHKGQSTPILSMEDAINITEKLARAFAVYPITRLVVLEALRGVKQYQLQFWDAQIWASAHLNQIPTIFSEDNPGGAILEGVRYINPFASGFQLQDWIGR